MGLGNPLRNRVNDAQKSSPDTPDACHCPSIPHRRFFFFFWYLRFLCSIAAYIQNPGSKCMILVWGPQKRSKNKQFAGAAACCLYGDLIWRVWRNLGSFSTGWILLLHYRINLDAPGGFLACPYSCTGESQVPPNIWETPWFTDRHEHSVPAIGEIFGHHNRSRS